MAELTPPAFGQVTILAPGLLGASVLMAVRQRGLAARTAVWARRQETRDACAAQPWCDAAYATAAEAVKDADLIILCPPVEHIVPLLQQIAPHLKSGAIVTDVGSTKAGICAGAAAVALPTGCAFIGSHPMAGSEKTGLENGRADLFEGRTCLVIEPAHFPSDSTPAATDAGAATTNATAGTTTTTATATTAAAAFARVCDFWRAVGMRVFTPTAAEHDRLVAEVSHLPHVLASVLSAWLARDGHAQERRNVAGPGLRDTTRIAAGDPDLWLSIIRENRSEIVHALEGFLAAGESMLTALQTGEDARVREVLAQGKQARDLLG